MKQLISGLLAVGVSCAFSLSASAALQTSYQFNGKGNWSLDGVGSNDTPVGSISAVVPVGSTVEAAFLYSSLNFTNSIPTVNFEGITYAGSDWVSLGINGTLQAYRTDVTAQIASLVGGGSLNPFSFTVGSEAPNGQIDGEVLAVIYSNPNEEERTIAFLDGASDSSGDSASINLSQPLTATELADPTFEAALSLGIGYGFQGDGQYSTVDVNGQRLTSCAGGQDDGVDSNGGLITVGGIGDSLNGPDCSLSGARQDDELYSLLDFLQDGDNQIIIDTQNPSSDDNIFFAGINITAVADVDVIDDNPVLVSESGSLVLMGFGLLGLGALRRKIEA